VTGVILVGFVGKQEEQGNSILGNILMILSVFAWAIYTLLSKRVNEYDSIVLVSLITFIGTALLLPAVAIELWNQKIPSLSAKAWAAVIYLGVFSSALCFILYNNALKTLSAHRSAIF
jgi:drug/metabolite transporter (DMT)-like permease